MKQFFFYILTLSNICLGQKYDIILKNGRIVDGTGNAWFRGDVGIVKDQIEKIGIINAEEGKTVIHADGQIICPGFIDVHAHVEESLPKNPLAENFIYDGVTSLITGNCGSSEVNLAAFFNQISMIGVSVNVGSLIGHNDVREAVLKNENRDPTADEQQQMERLVEKAMYAGAMGLATGLIYLPGTYAKTAEVVGLAKVAAKYGGIYASHIRDEGKAVEEAITEAINIGKEAKLPVEISHFKISFKPKWGKTNTTIGLVEAARAAGIDVNIDQYPYTASSTNMGTMVPSWARAGADSLVLARFADSLTRKKIIDEMVEGLRQDLRTNYDYAFIARCPADSSLNGKHISQVNLERNRPATAASEADLIIDLVAKGGAQMVFHKMDETDVENILKYQHTMIASDAGVATMGVGVPHPRGYGTNSRVLARYVRDKKTIALEDAIRKMTSLPAQRFKIADRGLLKPGYKADILIFDESQIQDMATFEKPHAYAKGISTVIVNGSLVLSNGKHQHVRSGKVLFGPAKNQ